MSDYVTVKITALESDFSFNVSQQTVSFTDLSSGAASWFWEFDDGNTSTQQNPVHTYSVSGTYNVKLTINNSPCSRIYTVSVLSGLDVLNVDSDISIYPNPASEILNVEFKTAFTGHTRIEIRDLDGRTVGQGEIQAGKKSFSWNVKDLSESV